ncbi:MAG: hypothetical protein AABY22_08275 [Nanoarchaeota archaeon]
MKKRLIIIDMFARDMKYYPQKNKLIQNQLKLIEAFKKAKQKVIIAGSSKDGKPIKAPKNPVMIKLWGDEESKNPEDQKPPKQEKKEGWVYIRISQLHMHSKKQSTQQK